MRTIILAALCSVLASACAGAVVYTPPVQTALQVPADRTLIVAPLAAHATPPVVFSGRYGPMAMSSGFSPDRVHAVNRDLHALLAASHVALEDERDLGGQTPGPGAYLLRLEVGAYRDSISFATGDIIACAIVGGLTVGLGALPCVSTRNSAVQIVEVDARLYAATGARSASVPVDGHLETSVDVTDRRPLWHDTFRVQLGVGYNLAGITNPTFEDTEDERLAELIFAQLAPALARGLAMPVPQGALGPPPPIPPMMPLVPPAPPSSAPTVGSL